MPRTILLADDSVTIQKVVELTFMEEDYEVVAVGSGDEAIERLNEVSPDLVVADVHMPGVSGFEVCREVKQRRPGIPVLLLVGTFEPFDPAEGEAAGADRHLKKPFDSQELLQTVQELVPAQADGAEDRAASDTGEAEEVAEAADEAETEAAEPVAPEAVAVEPTGEEPEVAVAAEPGIAEQPAEPEPAAASPSGALSDADVDRVARRVVELLGEDPLREVAWEVVPDLAELVIKDRLRELESQVE
jgi:CheY-like chemotaxis protein